MPNASPVICIITFLLLLTGCESYDNGIIDPSFDLPYITSLSVSPQLVNTDTVGVNTGIQKTDSITVHFIATMDIEIRGAEISAVEYSVKSQFSPTPLKTGTLQPPDFNDSESATITQHIDLRLSRSDVGRYSFTFSAQTKDGLTSNKISKTAHLFRSNLPPVIVKVDAPDTLTVTATTSFDISVTADDPDGTDDVVRVHFYSVNPNGIRGISPFVLDKIKPGLFQGIFRVEPSNMKGTYTFEFQAFDRSGDASEIYEHRLTLL